MNFTGEVEATISSQESPSPPIQRQVEQSIASQAVEINITEPFQPADFNFPKKHCGKQNRAFQFKKKALARFKEHQVSECHKIGIDYNTNLSRTCGNAWEMSRDAAKKTMESNRICLIKVMFAVSYPARTGYAG